MWSCCQYKKDPERRIKRREMSTVTVSQFMGQKKSDSSTSSEMGFETKNRGNSKRGSHI
jgi:hypothetical protein